MSRLGFMGNFFIVVGLTSLVSVVGVAGCGSSDSGNSASAAKACNVTAECGPGETCVPRTTSTTGALCANPAGTACTTSESCKVPCKCDDGTIASSGACSNGVCAAADQVCAQACGLFGGKYTNGNFCPPSSGTTGGTTTGGTTTGGETSLGTCQTATSMTGGATTGGTTTGGTTTGGTTGATTTGGGTTSGMTAGLTTGGTTAGGTTTGGGTTGGSTTAGTTTGGTTTGGTTTGGTTGGGTACSDPLGRACTTSDSCKVDCLCNNGTTGKSGGCMGGTCRSADEACAQLCNLVGGGYTTGNFCKSGSTTGGSTTGGSTTGGTTGGGTTGGGTTGGGTATQAQCSAGCAYQFAHACAGAQDLGTDPANCTTNCMAEGPPADCATCLGSQCIDNCAPCN